MPRWPSANFSASACGLFVLTSRDVLAQAAHQNISGNVTVACTVSGSYPDRQLSCSDGGQSFGKSLKN